ncbi:MAG: MAPEG family protein [Cupriavidus sp.]|nr:MAG: MAPEG family protein [Cupriavidus sp.]
MTAFAAVLYYVLWTIVLVLIYAVPRVPLALFTDRTIDSWERNKPVNDAPFFQRAKGAHLNSLENLPAFAVVVIIATLMGKSAVVDGLACYVLYARVAQSVVHLIGNSSALVPPRAILFVAQVLLVAYMALMLLH